MNRVEKLTRLVQDFYEDHRISWTPAWTEYLYKNHIFFVAEIAKSISEKMGVSSEFSEAASLLHDIADAIMDRNNPNHTKESENIAINLLKYSDFTEKEIEVIVYDTIRNHSCRDWIVPGSIEWKIMATADAIGHLRGDFYQFSLVQKQMQYSLDEIREWALPKIERDFYQKICFDEIREEYRTDYERCKAFFIK